MTTHLKALFVQELGRNASRFGTWGLRCVPPVLLALVALLPLGSTDLLLSAMAITGMFLFGIAASFASRDRFDPHGWQRAIDMVCTTPMRIREIFLVRLAAAGLPFLISLLAVLPFFSLVSAHGYAGFGESLQWWCMVAGGTLFGINVGVLCSLSSLVSKKRNFWKLHIFWCCAAALFMAYPLIRNDPHSLVSYGGAVIPLIFGLNILVRILRQCASSPKDAMLSILLLLAFLIPAIALFLPGSEYWNRLLPAYWGVLITAPAFILTDITCSMERDPHAGNIPSRWSFASSFLLHLDPKGRARKGPEEISVVPANRIHLLRHLISSPDNPSSRGILQMSREEGASVWSMFGMMITGVVVFHFYEAEGFSAMFGMWILADLLLYSFVLPGACRMLEAERRSGILETILVTPISGSVVADAVHRAWMDKGVFPVRILNLSLAIYLGLILVELLIDRREDVSPVLIVLAMNLLFANRVRSRHLWTIGASEGLHRTGTGFRFNLGIIGMCQVVPVLLCITILHILIQNDAYPAQYFLCIACPLYQCFLLMKPGQKAHRKLYRIRQHAQETVLSPNRGRHRFSSAEQELPAG